MGGDVLRADLLPQAVGETLGEATGVREDQRSAVLSDVARDHVEQIVPLLLRRDTLQILGWRHVDRQIDVPLVSQVDHRAARSPSVRAALGAHQEARDQIHGTLRRRQTHASGARLSESLESFQRQRQVRPAFVASQRVNLVDDHRAR